VVRTPAQAKRSFRAWQCDILIAKTSNFAQCMLVLIHGFHSSLFIDFRGTNSNTYRIILQIANGITNLLLPRVIVQSGNLETTFYRQCFFSRLVANCPSPSPTVGHVDSTISTQPSRQRMCICVCHIFCDMERAPS
jgi:hypothetical protein